MASRGIGPLHAKSEGKMGSKTGIEWTDATWNPLRGCSRVSEGCRNCYAETMAHRFSGPGKPYEGLTQIVNGHPAWTGKVMLVEKHLLDPLKWRMVRTQTEPEEIAGWYSERPRRIFVNSMSDLFHPNVPDAWIAKIVAVMIRASFHIFQVLTKRPERMSRLLTSADFWRLVNAEIYASVGVIVNWKELPSKVHLGVSVESAEHKDRIDILRAVPAAVRMLSLEPLLADLGEIDLAGIGWVIVGGESGPGARPMHLDWARSLRDQCVTASVPFFFKQWGDYYAHTNGRSCAWHPDGWNPENKKGGSLLDGREWKEFPR
ncbi:MAG: phage Gp37/Gp68 family protein [Acidobacteriaceae bacterium]